MTLMGKKTTKRRERVGSISGKKVESIMTKVLTICAKMLESRKMPSKMVSLTLLITKFLSLRKDTIDLTFEGVEGLNPDPEKHQFHMLVQVIELS